MKDKLPIEMLLVPTSNLTNQFLYHSRPKTSATAEEALLMASGDFMAVGKTLVVMLMILYY